MHESFAALEDPDGASHLLEGSVDPLFEFVAEDRVQGLGELRARLSDLRATYPQIEYRIDQISVDSAGAGIYEVRFDLDRRALDRDGALHVARRGHTWTVRHAPGDAVTVLRIDERPRLAFPGTGPQIVCY